ncbi:MAG: sugar ABC transporter ATP-binding protein [Phycisphaerales bacterium]|nr:sugar ABC transporter ATP-binding protein [Phycisphaerales bacterium]
MRPSTPTTPQTPEPPQPGPQEILLRAEHISKRFGITQALDDVSVSFRKGEVHALMGENGAGKSTLGKVIAGLHRADTGTVTILDPTGAPRVLRPGSIDDAFDAGVRLVHQELAQCPNLSVAENLSLHDIPTTRLGLVDRRAMNDRAARLVHKLDPGIDVETPLGRLAPGRRQICQIAAALDDDRAAGKAGARVIVLDEPTSSLSIAEADRLLEITRRLAAEGITIIYVSHRMGEIFAVCDRVTVLRDGRYIATSVVAAIDEPTLVEQMIGRRLQAPGPRSNPPASTAAGNENESAALRELAGGPGRSRSAGEALLEVRDLNSPGRLRGISLQVRAGEIVGLGGLVGSGRSEVLDAVFALDRRASGDVRVAGRAVNLASPGARGGPISCGVGYVPEDRRLQGLFFQLGCDENIVTPVMPRLARMLGIRSAAHERAVVDERLREFQVKCSSPAALPGSLSGGNQQKLLIARWMGKSSRVLLLDEPTRGIDVGTKSEIYRLVRAAAESGAAVLLVSSEMPELLALSDRILVMCEGRITGELTGAEMTQANILRLATIESKAGRSAAG